MIKYFTLRLLSFDFEELKKSLRELS